ncbi:hypothetical protein BDV95DRAFT_568154 [Massariosphaeria phaeospora]|uniref:Uncharacterized protein n=1 Tax=Massariosphaeria phaeospora TaxID=100035 RepID=A0A7C8MGP2_9PLEO|nr:hypothetical protein BDV95DRAFT_568154 [Massariosphaeria phaeospora]
MVSTTRSKTTHQHQPHLEDFTTAGMEAAAAAAQTTGKPAAAGKRKAAPPAEEETTENENDGPVARTDFGVPTPNAKKSSVALVEEPAGKSGGGGGGGSRGKIAKAAEKARAKREAREKGGRDDGGSVGEEEGVAKTDDDMDIDMNTGVAPPNAKNSSAAPADKKPASKRAKTAKAAKQQPDDGDDAHDAQASSAVAKTDLGAPTPNTKKSSVALVVEKEKDKKGKRETKKQAPVSSRASRSRAAGGEEAG